MNWLWVLIQVFIGYNLILPMALLMAYQLKRLFGRNRVNSRSQVADYQQYDYALIVTAYQETSLLPAAIRSLLQLNYDNYLIYVVADNCDISKILIDDDRVILLRPEQVLASNVGSHFYAINHFKRAHELLVIVDSDNIIHPEFLNECDTLFNKGYHAVQGLRKAKNQETDYARLDAARDIYYHFYDGEVLFGLGSSATLAGSGMAFRVSLYKACFEGSIVSGAGFDKVLQACIVLQDHRIAFTKKAVIYDGKTSYADQLVNQRARWLNTWFKYVGFGYQILIKGIRRLSINQLLFGLVLLRPPLFLFLALSVICLVVNLMFSSTGAVVWLLALLLFIAGFFVALWQYPAEKMIYRSLARIPLFVFYQFVSLINVRKANRRSVATRHVRGGTGKS